MLCNGAVWKDQSLFLQGPVRCYCLQGSVFLYVTVRCGRTSPYFDEEPHSATTGPSYWPARDKGDDH